MLTLTILLALSCRWLLRASKWVLLGLVLGPPSAPSLCGLLTLTVINELPFLELLRFHSNPESSEGGTKRELCCSVSGALRIENDTKNSECLCVGSNTLQIQSGDCWRFWVSSWNLFQSGTLPSSERNIVWTAAQLCPQVRVKASQNSNCNNNKSEGSRSRRLFVSKGKQVTQ